MARDVILRSDLSGQEIEPGLGARIKIEFKDGRTNARVLDVTRDEALELAEQGREIKRRRDRKRDPESGQFLPDE